MCSSGCLGHGVFPSLDRLGALVLLEPLGWVVVTWLVVVSSDRGHAIEMRLVRRAYSWPLVFLLRVALVAYWRFLP